MFHPAVPLDSLYIVTFCIAAAVSCVLLWFKAHQAWHALAFACVLGPVGLWTFLTIVTELDPDVSTLFARPALAPTLSFLGIGKTMGLAAIWLGLLHHWLGPKTKNLCIAAIWVTITTDPISYLGQNAKIPDATLYKSTTSQHFTDALTHNSRLDTALIIVTILGIFAFVILFLTPLIWKLAHWRKST